MTQGTKNNISRSLKEVMSGLACHIAGDLQNVAISAVTADSRKVVPGALFVAITGMTVDGHKFIDQVVEAGAAAVVVRKGYVNQAASKKVVMIETDDSQNLLGELAAAFYGHPARKMQMIGITGTNGKTTTTYLLENMIKEAGGNPGVFGTVTYRYNSKEIQAPFTTPEPVALHSMLKEMADNGVTHVVMEVSSHALEQKRLQGLLFDVAIFTNLSREHLDFHGNMERYFNSKKKLFFEYLRDEGAAIICEAPFDVERNDGGSEKADWGRKLYEEMTAGHGSGAVAHKKVLSCGFQGKDIYPRDHSFDFNGTKATIATPGGTLSIQSPMVGDFNLNNILVAVGVGTALEIDLKAIKRALENIPVIPGRLQRFSSRAGVEVFVDYAHTPDALENVLKTVKKLDPARLIVIFGCGGDRDKGKRPLMGKVAAELADVVVITSDNPRTEDPERIIKDILQGVLDTGMERKKLDELLGKGEKGYDIIESRADAISGTLRHAVKGDVVLVSGKGHEDYQLTRQGKTFFDDRVEVKKYLGPMENMFQAAACV